MARFRRVPHDRQNRVGRRKSSLVACGKDHEFVVFDGGVENLIEGFRFVRNVTVAEQAAHPAPRVAVDLDVVVGFNGFFVEVCDLIDHGRTLNGRVEQKQRGVFGYAVVNGGVA